MQARIANVADLLMGAAHADAFLHGQEKVAVRRILREVLKTEALPMDLDFRIDEFKPAAFDVAAAAAPFAADPPETKRHILRLIAEVHAADEEHDFAEDDYLRRVAGLFGFAEGSYDELVATILEEIDLDHGAQSV
jgi:uncharacterized tellurite resistance protein B-like protein